MNAPIATERICWGQQWSWNEQQLEVGRRSSSLLLVAVFRRPQALSCRVVREAVRVLVQEYPTLRTTYSTADDGVPRQMLWPVSADLFVLTEDEEPVGSGSLPSPERLHDGAAIDIEKTWPFSVHVFHGREGHAQVTITFHHIAIDHVGYWLVKSRFEELLDEANQAKRVRGRPTGASSIDIAQLEESEAGQQVNARAMDHWLRERDKLEHVLEALQRRFEVPSTSTHVTRASSHRAAGAADRAVATQRLTAAGVANAAVATALGNHLGFASVPLHCMVSNRHIVQYRNVACSVAQPGLALIEHARDLTAALSESTKATLAAIRHARYDASAFGRLPDPYKGFSTALPVRLPSVNYFESADPAPVPEDAETYVLKEINISQWLADSACRGFFFSVYRTGADLVIELRVGTHLAGPELARELVKTVMENILMCTE